MSNMKKLLDIMNETTVSGSIAAGPAVGLGTQRRDQGVYSEADDGTKAPDAPKAKEFGLWKNSVLAGAEQRDKKKSKKSSVAEGMGDDIKHAVKGIKRKLKGKPSLDDVQQKHVGDAVAAFDAGDKEGFTKNRRKWYKTLKMPTSPMKYHGDVSEGESKLYKHHQELRKKSGLPHPDEYLKMMKIKQAEIDALRAEIEADKQKQLKELDCGAGQRQLKLAEENISEEQLLAKELARRLDLFMKGMDHELGKKSADREILPKTEPSTGAMREDDLDEVKSPDKNDPWEQGWSAGHIGDFDCPYDMGTEEYKRWQEGFDEAGEQSGHYDESVEGVAESFHEYLPAIAAGAVGPVGMAAGYGAGWVQDKLRDRKERKEAERKAKEKKEVEEGIFGDKAGKEINYDSISRLSDEELQKAYKFSSAAFNTLDPEHRATAKALRNEIKKRKQDVAEGWFSKSADKSPLDDRNVKQLMQQDHEKNPNMDAWSWQIGWVYADGNNDVKKAFSDAYHHGSAPFPPEERSFTLGFNARKKQGVAEGEGFADMWKRTTPKKKQSAPTSGSFADMEKKEKEYQSGQKKRKEQGVTEQFSSNPGMNYLMYQQFQQLGQAVAQLSPEDLSTLATMGKAALGGGAIGGAAVSLGFKFLDAIRDTMTLVKNKAKADTSEISALQKQIVSINKMLARVKTDAAKEKYQNMLKQAYEVLDELKARHDNQVDEGSDDIHSARVGDEIALKNPNYRGIIVKIDGDNISFKNESDGKRYKATMRMIDRNLSQEQRYKEKSGKENKRFDDAMARDMERIDKSGALKKFGIGVAETSNYGDLDEVAPPGEEKLVRKLKKEYPGHPEKAFATAWSIYNKQHGKK